MLKASRFGITEPLAAQQTSKTVDGRPVAHDATKRRLERVGHLVWLAGCQRAGCHRCSALPSRRMGARARAPSATRSTCALKKRSVLLPDRSQTCARWGQRAFRARQGIFPWKTTSFRGSALWSGKKRWEATVDWRVWSARLLGGWALVRECPAQLAQRAR